MPDQTAQPPANPELLMRQVPDQMVQPPANPEVLKQWVPDQTAQQKDWGSAELADSEEQQVLSVQHSDSAEPQMLSM